MHDDVNWRRAAPGFDALGNLARLLLNYARKVFIETAPLPADRAVTCRLEPCLDATSCQGVHQAVWFKWHLNANQASHFCHCRYQLGVVKNRKFGDLADVSWNKIK